MNETFVSQVPQTIYLNSNYAASSNSTQNQILFSFDTLISKEPDDLVFASLQSFTSFNTFPSISQYQKNNIVKVINRMYNAVTKVYTDYLTSYVIPDNHYNSSSLMALLNTNLQRQEQVYGANWVSTDTNTSFLYLGLGFNGLNNLLSTIPIQGFLIDAVDGGRSCIQSGVNAFSNAYQKTYTSGSISTDPYVYAGVYLVYDDETKGFLKSIGFKTSNNSIPVATSGILGFGYSFDITQTPYVQPIIQSPLVMNLAGPTNLYITIDRISTNSRHNEPSMDRQSIVGCIPVDVFYGEYINFQQQNSTTQFIDELNTLSFTVTIYDQNLNLVDFRGGSWLAEIVIEVKSNARNIANNQMNPGIVPSVTQKNIRPNPSHIMSRVNRRGDAGAQDVTQNNGRNYFA